MELSQMLDPQMILKVSAIIVMVNGILLGCYKILEAVAKFTATKADDNIAAAVKKVLDMINNIISIALGSLGKKD